MQPRKNEPVQQARLFRLTEHIGNTTQLLLEIAKSMLRNGKKLFNSNLVLRKYVANDLKAANLKDQFKGQVPSLTRDMEIIENIVNKYRLSAKPEDKAKVEQYYNMLEKLSKEAKQYEAKREILQQKITNFIKEHPGNIQEMIDKMQ